MLTQTGQEIERGTLYGSVKREFHIEGMRLGYISTIQGTDEDNKTYKLVFHWVKIV